MAKKSNPIDRTNSRVDALITLFAKTEAELTRLIFTALTSGKMDGKRYRNQQRAAAARLLEGLEKAAVPQAGRLVNAAYLAGETEARRLLKAKPESARKQATVAKLDKEFRASLRKATSLTAHNVDRVLRKEALRIVRAGTTSDTDTTKMAQQLADRLTKQGVTGFVDKAGKKWTLASYSKMAVTTVANHAVNAGTIDTMRSRDFDLVEINSVPNPSKVCAPHEGVIYSISGNHPTYPKLEDGPPYHPGPCRHYASPSKLALADRRERQERAA